VVQPAAEEHSLAQAALLLPGGLGHRWLAPLHASASGILKAQLITRELVLLVRVRSAEEEAKATEILQGHGGQAVRPHEITIDKRLEHLPLHSLRVDPWLGDEPLARP